MRKEFLLAVLMLLTFCVCQCIENTILVLVQDSLLTKPVKSVQFKDSISINTPYPPSFLAGYHDGWKKKDINSEYIAGALVLGVFVPFIGNTILYGNIRGATPDSIPAGLDTLLYVKGYREASLSKRQISVGVPRRITNYVWSSGLSIFLVALAIFHSL